MKTMHINDFCLQCGFFEENTDVNNGYGCNHPEQEETEIVKINDSESRLNIRRLNDKIAKTFMRKKYGSYKKIIEALETDEGKKHLFLCRHDFLFDKEKLSEIGLKRQGMCFSYSCPIAIESEEDYMVPLQSE